MAIDRERFIRDHLTLGPLRGADGIVLYQAHAGSGLGRLTTGGKAPYWAYAWAGGLALVQFLRERPETVAGLRVMDFGTGSGLVAIAAAQAGAASVLAVDVDPMALAATAVNAEANRVTVATLQADLLLGAAPEGIDVVIAADVFYERAIGRRTMRFLGRCLEAGQGVLVGDPGRVGLDRTRLQMLGDYAVNDFGVQGPETVRSAVYKLV